MRTPLPTCCRATRRTRGWPRWRLYANLRLRSSRGFDQAVTLLETALRRYLAAGMDAAAGTVHSRIGGALSLHHSVMDIPRALEHFEAAERLLGDFEGAFHVNRGRSQAAMFGLRTDVLGAAADKAASIAAEAGRRDLGGLRRLGPGLGGGQRRTSHRCDRASRARMGDRARVERSLSGLGPGQRRGLGGKRVPARPWDGAALVPTQSGTTAVHLARPQPRHGHRPARAGPGHHRRCCRRPGGAVVPAPGRSGASDDDVPGRRLGDGAGRLRQGGRRGRGGRRLARRRAQLRVAGRCQTRLGRSARSDGRMGAGARSGAPRATGADGARRACGAGPAQAQPTTWPRPTLHLDRCEEILASGEDWRGAAGRVELAHAEVAGAQGDAEGADAHAARAIEVFTTFGLPWHRADALRCWARLLAGRGQDEGADERRRQADQGVSGDRRGRQVAAGRWALVIGPARRFHAFSTRTRHRSRMNVSR